MDFLTLDDIAQDLRLSSRSIRRLAKGGELPAITRSCRGGHHYVVPIDLYLNWKKTRYLKKKEESLFL